MNLDPMFPGIYLCEPNADFWRKRASLYVERSTQSLLLDARYKSQLFTAEESFRTVLLFREADLEYSIQDLLDIFKQLQ